MARELPNMFKEAAPVVSLRCRCRFSPTYLHCLCPLLSPQRSLIVCMTVATVLFFFFWCKIDVITG